MMEIILAGVVSLVITLAAGKLLIPALIRLKAGQSIKEVGPTWHKGKQGTPTMGGLMFIIGIGIAILILGWKGMLEGNFTHLYVYVFALVFGVIGYIDDYQKVKHHQNTGLTAPQKFLLQLAAAVAFLCLMRYEGMLSPNLYIPFFNTHLVLPWVVYMIFAAFVIIGTVNAVNITDGVDGLSSSVTVPVAVFFAVLGFAFAHPLVLFMGAQDEQTLLGGEQVVAYLAAGHAEVKLDDNLFDEEQLDPSHGRLVGTEHPFAKGGAEPCRQDVCRLGSHLLLAVLEVDVDEAAEGRVVEDGALAGLLVVHGAVVVGDDLADDGQLG